MRLKKKQKDFDEKRNVAIKRVKSNASALAVSSDSNIDEVKPHKSLKNISSILLKRGIFRSCLKPLQCFKLQRLVIWETKIVCFRGGFVFENICLEFKDGKIINATANDTDRINKVLDADEGARYVGEFAIGVNPYILEPMKDTLFDEKIAGSIHFTPGNAYKGCNNGNQSSLHWDLVLIQRPEYGGGEIYFDDVLIRKDGRFVLPELDCLNPENLV